MTSDINAIGALLVAGLLTIFVLFAIFGRRFLGMKSWAEERAEKKEAEQRQQEAERVAQVAHEAKLAAMTESERSRYIERQFRQGALGSAGLCGAIGFLAYYGLVSGKVSSEWGTIFFWGLLACGVGAVAYAYAALVGRAFAGKSFTALLYVAGWGIAIAVLYWVWTGLEQTSPTTRALIVLTVVVAVGFYAVVKAIERNKGS